MVISRCCAAHGVLGNRRRHCAGRSDDNPCGVHVGRPTRSDDCAATRRLLVVHCPPRLRHRGARLRLCSRLFLSLRAGPRPVRCNTARFLGRNARPGPRRHRLDNVPLLGAHLDHLIPARRAPADRSGGQDRSATCPRDNSRWRPRAAWRVRRTERCRSWPVPQRSGTGHRHWRNRRSHLDPHRGCHKVGPSPVPHLAPRRNEGTDAGERLPALGHDGESWRRPRRRGITGTRADVGMGRPLASRSEPPQWSGAPLVRSVISTPS